MNTQLILHYLTELSNHNEREWYHAHKAEYREANAEFEELVQDLILKIGKFDSSVLHNQPKDLTFKLVRDTRFSHDKSPYNPAFRAHISSMGKLPVPVGYYLMIKPGGQSFFRGRLVCGYVQGSYGNGSGLHRGKRPGVGGDPGKSGLPEALYRTGDGPQKCACRV